MKSKQFPFAINKFYNKEEIWRGLEVGARGGIRVNKEKNFVVVFSDVKSDRISMADYGRNVYADYYDSASGLYQYTGEGQQGNQKFVRGNKWLRDAVKNGTKIHFFRQYAPKAKHEYLGLMEPISHHEEQQEGANGKKRTVIVFWLKPISHVLLTEQDAVYREIESEISREARSESKQQIEQRIEELNHRIKLMGPKTIEDRAQYIQNIHYGDRYNRLKSIVKNLKLLYDKECQICGLEHFKTQDSSYSEVHHLIPLS